MARYEKFLSATAAAWCAATTLCATAHADPDFPDLNNFSPVDIAPYQASQRGTPYISFSTPDGLSCSFAAYSDKNDPNIDQGLSCTGNLQPGSTLPKDHNWCMAGRVATEQSGLIYHLKSAAVGIQCGDSGQGRRLLEVGSKISLGNITCAVGAGDLTACLDTRVGQRHGFVVQPAGSTAF
jgi:hypothetical protein